MSTSTPSDRISARARGLELAAALMTHLPAYHPRGWVPWGGWHRLWLLLISDDGSPMISIGLTGGIWLVEGTAPRQVVAAQDDATVSVAVERTLAALGHECTPARCEGPPSDELVTVRLVCELARHLAQLGLKSYTVPIQRVESPEFELGAWSFGTTAGRHFVVHGLEVWELAAGRWIHRLDLDERREAVSAEPSTAAYQVLADLGLTTTAPAPRRPGRPANLIRWGTT